jgi:putative endonuclease
MDSSGKKERKPHDRIVLGARGEQQAARYLTRKGYTVLEHSFRTRAGEIDLIAEKDGTIVFIEVKTRLSARFGLPMESVTSWKRQKIIRTALLYLQKRNLLNRKCRFDVVSIAADSAGKSEIRHIESAFEAEGPDGGF